jgi:hypothetical protein
MARLRPSPSLIQDIPAPDGRQEPKIQAARPEAAFMTVKTRDGLAAKKGLKAVAPGSQRKLLIFSSQQRGIKWRALYTFFRTLLNPSIKALLGKIKATIAAV